MCRPRSDSYAIYNSIDPNQIKSVAVITLHIRQRKQPEQTL